MLPVSNFVVGVLFFGVEFASGGGGRPLEDLNGVNELVEDSSFLLSFAPKATIALIRMIRMCRESQQRRKPMQEIGVKSENERANQPLVQQSNYVMINLPRWQYVASRARSSSLQRFNASTGSTD